MKAQCDYVGPSGCISGSSNIAIRHPVSGGINAVFHLEVFYALDQGDGAHAGTGLQFNPFQGRNGFSPVISSIAVIISLHITGTDKINMYMVLADSCGSDA